MTIFERILEVTRRQAEAVRSGSLEGAIALLDFRGQLVTAAPAAGSADEPVIREIIELERELATAIRYRMLDVRESLLAGRHGQQALAGYASSRQRTPLVFEAGA